MPGFPEGFNSEDHEEDLHRPSPHPCSLFDTSVYVSGGPVPVKSNACAISQVRPPVHHGMDEEWPQSSSRAFVSDMPLTKCRLMVQICPIHVAQSPRRGSL